MQPVRCEQCKLAYLSVRRPKACDDPLLVCGQTEVFERLSCTHKVPDQHHWHREAEHDAQRL